MIRFIVLSRGRKRYPRVAGTDRYCDRFRSLRHNHPAPPTRVRIPLVVMLWHSTSQEQELSPA